MAYLLVTVDWVWTCPLCGHRFEEARNGNTGVSDFCGTMVTMHLDEHGPEGLRAALEQFALEHRLQFMGETRLYSAPLLSPL